jgi:hypothetical protein
MRKRIKFNNILEGENGINEPEKIYIYKVNTNVNKKYRLNIFSITSTEFDLSNLNFEKNILTEREVNFRNQKS